MAAAAVGSCRLLAAIAKAPPPPAPYGVVLAAALRDSLGTKWENIWTDQSLPSLIQIFQTENIFITETELWPKYTDINQNYRL